MTRTLGTIGRTCRQCGGPTKNNKRAIFCCRDCYEAHQKDLQMAQVIERRSLEKWGPPRKNAWQRIDMEQHGANLFYRYVRTWAPGTNGPCYHVYECELQLINGARDRSEVEFMNQHPRPEELSDLFARTAENLKTTPLEMALKITDGK